MVLPYAKTEPLYNLLKYHRPCFMILFVCFHNSVLSFLYSYIFHSCGRPKSMTKSNDFLGSGGGKGQPYQLLDMIIFNFSCLSI